jgi:hypothetical protein
MDHQLLRLGVVDTAFALKPSDIKSFRILEDGEVLYEGEKGNFRSYKSDIKERLNELKPRIDEYRMLRHQYEMMEEMRRSMDENNRRDDRREDLDHRDYRDRVNEPDFNIPNPVEKFAVEITHAKVLFFIIYFLLLTTFFCCLNILYRILPVSDSS